MNTQSAFECAITILRHNLTEFTDQFQNPNSEKNFYPAVENIGWTTGFCTGQYWLAYEYTQDVAFRDAALVQVGSFLRRIEDHVDVDHHDMGFLYSPSCVAAYQLVGDETGKKAAILAADNLLSRFHEKGQFFQAWGELGAKDNYRLIIDCLLNLPLLYWASSVTGNDIYREKALAHTKTSLANLVREDWSTYHTYFFDPQTGAPLNGATHQGYRNDSAWARGQAWGIYGLALSYKYTKNPDCFKLFDKVTEFFLERLPKDQIPYWDLDFGDGDGEPKDSSAAVIAACGMLEMAKYLPDEKALYYKHWARKIARMLWEGYAVKDIKLSNGLLLHGVYGKNSPYNTCPDGGVDECNVWGDYFWLELLTRISKDWIPYW